MKTSPKVLIFPTKKQAVSYAADLIARQIKSKPSSALGLATGRTMIPLYKSLVSKKPNFSKIKTFNLDEYLKAKSSKSFRNFMDKKLFNKTNIKEKNINFLDSNSESISRECSRYETLLSKTRIDLQVLGIGRKGHIAFNEPGSSFKSKTRAVRLSSQTIRLNKSPPRALTMGIKTILRAKKIILLAFGKHKAEAVARAILYSPTTQVPASALRMHENALFILDKQAAIKLK